MNSIFRTAAAMMIAVLLPACGYFFHPDSTDPQDARHRVDPAAALNDRSGCLLFIVPDRVAFAVDFQKGLFYLPEGPQTNGVRLSPHRMDTSAMTFGQIQQIVHAQTGMTVSLQDPRMEIYRIPDTNTLTGVPTAFIHN